MAAKDPATATAVARSGDPMLCADITPIAAASRLPPIIDHGCANGLAGTPNNRTADAPIGAMSNGISEGDPAHKVLTTPVKAIPTNTPTLALNRSR